MASEPLAAVLAEMRREAGAQTNPSPLYRYADRIEAAVQRFVADDCAKCAHYNAATISLKDALDLANTIANHGINANDLGDKASATIYALCHEVRTVRGEDANIKQEVQKLRRELRDLRRASGNAAAMRKALEEQLRYWNSVVRTRDEEEMRKRTETALAAPARNCDRFQTAEEAYAAWQKLPNLASAFAWLFAPSEGGDHA